MPAKIWKTALLISLFLLLGTTSCTSSTEDLIGLLLNPPSRKAIDLSRTGVNNFFVDPEFGDIDSQYDELRNTLGRRFVRVLFAWTDAVQPTPDATPNYSFYDDIVAGIPAGVDILVTVVHTPAWMADSSNWVNGNPRQTFVDRWLRPTVRRYAGNPRIIGYQVWNEPDNTVFDSDARLELTDPSRYFELLALGSEAIRSADPTKLIVTAASRSIQQNGASNLNYNKELQALGAESLADIWAIHYYGEQFERVVAANGVGPFVRSLTLPVWITESGAEGPDQQLAFVETVWPFIDEEFGGKIQRFYYYQFGETGPNDTNFGLRQNGPVFVSDLYVHLRDNS